MGMIFILKHGCYSVTSSGPRTSLLAGLEFRRGSVDVGEVLPAVTAGCFPLACQAPH